MSDTPTTGDQTPPETPPPPSTDTPAHPADGAGVMSDTSVGGGAGVGGPTLSLSEAVRYTGAARSTLQRRLRDGVISGAHRTADGGWSIPVAGLIAAGLAPKSTPADEEPEPRSSHTADEVAELRAEVAEWRLENAELRAEADKWRTLAAERERWMVDLRGVIEVMSRSLPAGPEARKPSGGRWFRREK